MSNNLRSNVVLRTVTRKGEKFHVLACSEGHNFHRPLARGVKPFQCPKHKASKAPSKAPSKASAVAASEAKRASVSASVKAPSKALSRIERKAARRALAQALRAQGITPNGEAWERAKRDAGLAA